MHSSEVSLDLGGVQTQNWGITFSGFLSFEIFPLFPSVVVVVRAFFSDSSGQNGEGFPIKVFPTCTMPFYNMDGIQGKATINLESYLQVSVSTNFYSVPQLSYFSLLLRILRHLFFIFCPEFINCSQQGIFCRCRCKTPTNCY